MKPASSLNSCPLPKFMYKGSARSIALLPLQFRSSTACERVSRIPRVRQRYVNQNALQDDEDAKRIDADTENAADLVKMVIGP